MAIKKSILSYLGVVAPTPPNFLYIYRAPTVNDYKDYRIGCLWLVKDTELIYMLTDKKANVATWTLLSAGGTGTITQVDGGTNVTTVDPTGPIVTVNLDDSITLAGDLTLTAGDATIASLAEGVVQSDASGLLFANSGSDGQVIVGNTAGAADWYTLTSSDGSVVFTPGAATLDLRAVGGGGGGLTSMPTDSGTATVSGTGTIDILGGVNINTVASGASIVSVNLDNDVGVSGYLSAGTTVTAGTGITSTTGDIVASTGDITATLGSFTAGADATINGNLITPSIGPGVAQISSLGLFSASEGTNGQLLVGSILGAPTWANLTSTGGTVTITNGPNTINLEAAGGGGSVLAGDNININPASTVNLNKSISQPFTNASGTEGLYSLGGYDFMHNYGSNNVFLGRSAGNRTLTSASENTGIGQTALTALSTSERNVCIGYDAGSTLSILNPSVPVSTHSRGYNVFIGESAGTSHGSSAYNNIYIGSTGRGGRNDCNVIGTRRYYSDRGEMHLANGGCFITGIATSYIRESTHDWELVAVSAEPSDSGLDDMLGVPIVEPGEILIGVGGASFSTFRAGTVTSSNGTIVIDKTTPGNINFEYTGAAISAFRAFQTINLANMTGDGTYYWLGSSSALSEEYDIGGNFYPGSGSGAAASFVAPITGLYNFTLSVLLTNITVPPPPPTPPPSPVYQDPLSIVTSSRTYELINPALVYSGEQTLFYTVFAKMSAGHNAFFNCAIITDYLTKTVGIGATHTWVGGFLVHS